jgi:hypothetical protein
VLKNRNFEEGASSLMERNTSEIAYFWTSNFKCLPQDNLGIDSLRYRLSVLLFEHVKQELPKPQQDLEEALLNTKRQLEMIGSWRTTLLDCKAYLAQLSLDYYEICKAAVNRHYKGDYFHKNLD